jgi:alpha-glucosidase (family GH31 glycosyl hydrolase)
VLDQGIEGVWNDNNEFEVRAPAAQIFGFGARAPAISAKPLQSLLMMRASREAQLTRAPDLRPMGVSRAGAVGLHRYVQTWSGDNTTHWKTPRWNGRMGLGLALSGVSNFGHDIGGFAGPAPGPELFARSAAAGIFCLASPSTPGMTMAASMNPGCIRRLCPPSTPSWLCVTGSSPFSTNNCVDMPKTTRRLSGPFS